MPDPRPRFKDKLKQRLRPLFETPQKARTTATCLIVALATLAAIIVYIVYAVRNYGGELTPDPGFAVSEPVSDPPEEPSEPAYPTLTDPPGESSGGLTGIVPALTIDEARQFALTDAGLAEGQADISREALAEDNGIWVYEFRFRTDRDQYDYKVNANTGEIRAMVKETYVFPETDQPVMPTLPADSEPPAEPDPQPSETPQGAPEPAPTPEPTPSPEPTPAPSQSTGMFIGLDRAKTIALDHAGLTASQVRFTRTRMTRDGRSMVYELEFRQGLVEYAYRIDASTGRILDHRRDEG